jgi:hypothetical protein
MLFLCWIDFLSRKPPRFWWKKNTKYEIKYDIFSYIYTGCCININYSTINTTTNTLTHKCSSLIKKNMRKDKKVFTAYGNNKNGKINEIK